MVISIVEHLALPKLSDETEREKLAKALSERQRNIGWLLNIVEVAQVELSICRNSGQVKNMVRDNLALTLAMEGILPPHNYGAMMSAQHRKRISQNKPQATGWLVERWSEMSMRWEGE